MAVITSAVTDDQLAELTARDVDLVVDTTPQPYVSPRGFRSKTRTS